MSAADIRTLRSVLAERAAGPALQNERPLDLSDLLVEQLHGRGAFFKQTIVQNKPRNQLRSYGREVYDSAGLTEAIASDPDADHRTTFDPCSACGQFGVRWSIRLTYWNCIYCNALRSLPIYPGRRQRSQ